MPPSWKYLEASSSDTASPAEVRQSARSGGQVCGLHAAQIRGQTPGAGEPPRTGLMAITPELRLRGPELHAQAAAAGTQVPTARERTRASAGALLRPHDLLLLVCNGEADTAEQRVQVAPAVGGQAAAQTGRFVQLGLLLPAGVQQLLLRGAEPLQGLPVGWTRGRVGWGWGAAPCTAQGGGQMPLDAGGWFRGVLVKKM